MKRKLIIIITIAVVVVMAAVGFYYVLNGGQDVNFNEGVLTPIGISINGDAEIIDEIVVKTIVLELEKSKLEKATRRDMTDIKDIDKAFSINVIYDENVLESGRLENITVLQDKTFIASKKINGRTYYAKGKFSPYTMDFFSGLDAVQ